MKLSVIETDDEYKLVKEKPYQELLTIDTLIPVGFLFFILILIKFYLLIPVIIFFTAFASLQSLEDNFIIIIDKKTKEFTIEKYYMGNWKVKSTAYKASDFTYVQVEKQVTSIREDGRFSINLLTEPVGPDEQVKEVKESKEGKVKVFPLLKNIDLEDIEHAKVISFMLGLIYESKIKFKVELL